MKDFKFPGLGMFNQGNNQIFIPSLALMVIVTLFIVIVRIGTSQIDNQKNNILVLEKSVNILKQKESTLTDFNQSVGQGSEVLSYALPDKNPTLLVFTQIKTLSNNKGVIIQNLKAGSEVSDNNISKSDITFDVQGPTMSVIAFLSETQQLAPVISLQKVKLNQMTGAAMATTTIDSYWSDLPSKIPALDQPTQPLTSDEKGILDRASLLSRPSTMDLPSNGGAGKTNPFE